MIASLMMLSVFACQKSESSANSVGEPASETALVAAPADSVSYAASQKIPDRKFVKTADIDMEVKDVYDATIFIEKQLKDLGGFVTTSRLNSNVVSEDTYETSDSEAMLVKKYQSENKMQVRVPTERLGDFLTFINDKKLFLNLRVILAEDVTNNAKIAELEAKKIQKTRDVISQMKTNGDKVDRTENNLENDNARQIETMKLADNLKYSTVDIYIREPKVRVAEIAVTNTKNIDNKYKFNFFYDIKNAFVEGFYLIQKLIVLLVTVWPLLLIAGLIVYFSRKRSRPLFSEKPEQNPGS